MKVNLRDLVIEVTRKCNMKCKHCLRGKAEDRNIKYKAIDEVFKKIDGVYSLVITGGEPSLNVRGIRYILNSAKKHNVSIGTFYMATNGKNCTKGFVNVLKDLHYYCDDIESNYVLMSVDDYHEKIVPGILYDLDGLLHIEKHKLFENILSEGKAKQNKLGNKKLKVSRSIDIEVYNDEHMSYTSEGDAVAYINVDGDVMLSCDMSYKTQKKHIIGNVLKDSIIDILNKVGRRIE